MPYSFVADSFHRKKLCSRLSLSEVDFIRKTAVLRFWAPLWGPRGNIRWSSHWKACSLLPNSVNWTFFARCYGWGTTSEDQFKIGDFAPAGAGWPKISGRGVAPTITNHSSSPETRLNDLSYGIKIWTDLSSVLSQCTRLTDGRKGGQTPLSSLVRVAFDTARKKFINAATFNVITADFLPVFGHRVKRSNRQRFVQNMSST